MIDEAKRFAVERFVDQNWSLGARLIHPWMSAPD